LQARERFRNRDRQGAIDDYTQVLRYQPNNAEANFTRGLIYSGMDNRQNAIADLQRAAQLFREQGNENYYLIALEIIEDIQTRE
jgi:regulator of sirC expression with transglutaminase-like and TPR domain